MSQAPSEMQMLIRYLGGLRSSLAKKNVSSLRKPKEEKAPEAEVELELGEDELAALLDGQSEENPME